jgi:exopolyphosphatase/guanosine-5'-triphosphate,3'-diphosphate pyrophosphatase
VAPSRAAALDVGSLSVLLSVGELAPDGTLVIRREEAEVTRLAEGLREIGALTPAAMDRVAATVRRLAALAREDGASRLAAAGTAALRDATNADALLDRIRAETGIDLEIVDAAREAALSLAGVRSGIAAAGPIAVLDVGGGSTEITVDGPVSVSLPIGALRLAERFAEDRVEALRDHVSSLLPEIPGGAAPRTLRPVGVGGTITTLAAIDLSLVPYDSRRVEGHVLRGGRLRELRRTLAALRLDERRRHPILERGRADVIVQGTVVYEVLLERYGWESIEVSPRGLREGLLIETLVSA